MPVVSVIVPVYNAADTIRQALQSAVQQTLRNIEIIVFDDCSSDQSVAIVQAMAAQDHRIRLLIGDHNRGPSAGYNRAIAAATGTWLAILDADDWFTPERLNVMVDIALATDADFVLDNELLFDAGAGRMVGTAFPVHAGYRPIELNEFLRNCMTGLSRYDYGLLQPLLRRAFVERHNIKFHEIYRFGEDFLYMLDCFAADGKGILTFQAMYVVRQPVGTRSGQPSRLDRLSYDLENMYRGNAAAVEIYRDKLSLRDVKFLIRRGQSIQRYHKYLTLRFPLPIRLIVAMLTPQFWPYHYRAIRRRITAFRTIKPNA
jgi:succinoglycan biosynthesis protein ExoO